MRKSITALLGLSLIGLSAIADEVWSTPIGDVVYEDETDDGWAVWSYPGLTERGTVYIKDLAGVYEGRTAYAGIWIEAESPGIELCDVAVTDPATGNPTIIGAAWTSCSRSQTFLAAGSHFAGAVSMIRAIT